MKNYFRFLAMLRGVLLAAVEVMYGMGAYLSGMSLSGLATSSVLFNTRVATVFGE